LPAQTEGTSIVDDTAQPLAAAETEPVSREDSLLEAASAFKVHLGQEEPARGPDGRFQAAGAEDGDGEEEIEADGEGEQPDPNAESPDDGDEDEDAAEEAQQSEADMPASWPSEHAETWKALPPETQALIAEREGQRDAATNAKFQEAANLRKAHEAEINEAKTTRSRALQAMDVALAAIRPQEPPLSMLDAGSDDYDPDGYHLAKAQYQRNLAFIDGLAAQRDDLRAQEQQEAEQASNHLFQTINAATRAAFLRDVPDVTDQAKAPAAFQGLIEYAVAQGAPMEIFQTPTTALEWHTLWKAREYDKLQTAKAKVKTDPKPEPKKAQPAIRPGVTTPPSARKAARRQQNFERLARTGSIADGAAVWKDILKG
jgi:hypothetical protein